MMPHSISSPYISQVKAIFRPRTTPLTPYHSYNSSPHIFVGFPLTPSLHSPPRDIHSTSERWDGVKLIYSVILLLLLLLLLLHLQLLVITCHPRGFTLSLKGYKGQSRGDNLSIFSSRIMAVTIAMIN